MGSSAAPDPKKSAIDALKRQLEQVRLTNQQKYREIDAEFEPEETGLLNAIASLESPPAMFKGLDTNQAVAIYLSMHGWEADLSRMVADLQAGGAEIPDTPVRTAEHNVKIMIGQRVFRDVFSYDEETNVVRLLKAPTNKKRAKKGKKR
jgi:hypothetical protein